MMKNLNRKQKEERGSTGTILSVSGTNISDFQVFNLQIFILLILVFLLYLLFCNVYVQRKTTLTFCRQLVSLSRNKSAKFLL